MITLDHRALAEYLPRQRWFTGRDEAVEVQEIHPLGWLAEPGSGLGVRVELATVSDGVSTTVYNLPLAYRVELVGNLEHARIGTVVVDEVELHVYDALVDPEAIAVLMAGFAAPDRVTAELQYVCNSDIDLPLDTIAPLLVEQSNSSVIIDETAMLKFFRRVSPGRNPDVEVLAALSEEYSDTVPKLYGWLSTAEDSPVGACDLGILQTFLRTATEGWESARVSVRDLLAEPELAPEDAGGDFAGEAERLGAATRHVHEGMARLLPSGTWGAAELGALADRFLARFADAARVVPQLAERREAVAECFDAVRDLTPPVPVQRIHGDLHLGQTLRTSINWKLIDFEGEPARPLAERTRLDSPMRDVAGMVRSFDYVAQSVLTQVGESPTISLAAQAWTERNVAAFLRGYGAPESDLEATLLRAYEVDKAVYEVLYEAQHRPGWIAIPWRAIPG